MPGDLLRDCFLTPMGISRYRLAKSIGVPAQRIGEIVAGKRAITTDTDLRLCRFLGLPYGYWLRAQAAYDTQVARKRLSAELESITPALETAHEDQAPMSDLTTLGSLLTSLGIREVHPMGDATTLAGLADQARIDVLFVDTPARRSVVKTKVQRWGNSLAVRIPKAFAEEIGLGDDSPVLMRLTEAGLAIEPFRSSTPTLAELLAAVDESGSRGPGDSGVPRGSAPR